MSEYNQRIRHLSDSSSDPFKYALYKLIGRTEISRRNIPGVTNTTEDWLWVQLMLVRDQPESSNEPAHERFGLQDLAKVLVKFGENHFDPKGQRPLLYFQILLFCGQFERVRAGPESRCDAQLLGRAVVMLTTSLEIANRLSRFSMPTRATKSMPSIWASLWRTMVFSVCLHRPKRLTSTSVSERRT